MKKIFVLLTLFILSFNCFAEISVEELVRATEDHIEQKLRNETDPMKMNEYEILLDGGAFIRQNSCVEQDQMTAGLKVHNVFKPLLKPFKGMAVKEITICGRPLYVPVLSYLLCQASYMLLPAGCTIGTVTTAGSACAANIAIVSASCGVSILKVAEIAKACTGEGGKTDSPQNNLQSGNSGESVCRQNLIAHMKEIPCQQEEKQEETGVYFRNTWLGSGVNVDTNFNFTFSGIKLPEF